MARYEAGLIGFGLYWKGEVYSLSLCRSLENDYTLNLQLEMNEEMKENEGEGTVECRIRKEWH